jgi:hypothetical protein
MQPWGRGGKLPVSKDTPIKDKKKRAAETAAAAEQYCTNTKVIMIDHHIAMICRRVGYLPA